MAIKTNWGSIGMSTSTGSKVVSPGSVTYKSPSGTVIGGMSVAPKKVTPVFTPPTSPSYSAGMSTTKSPTGQVFYTSSGSKPIGYSSPTGNVSTPTTPTSYGAGTKIVANTPIISPQISATSLMTGSSTSTTGGTSYTGVGTSPTLASSSPSTNYNAANYNYQTGANPITGLYDTVTTNADGTPKVTVTTGTQTKALSPGEKLLKDYNIPAPEKPASITDEYYDSPAYKAEQRAMEQKNATQNAINAVTTRLNTDLANLRGVGAREGVTEAVYGQQTAEIIREANNQLLPLQAQLAADQGNLELATNTLNTWAKLRQDDIENQYNYKKSVRDELVKFATDDQKRRLDAAQKKVDQQFELDKMAIAFDYDKKLKEIGNSSKSSITPEDNRTLLGAGFTAQEAEDIANDVNAYGIDKVLARLTDPRQKTAVQTIYGGKDTTSKLTRVNLSNLFGIPDDDERKGILNWWGDTNREKLDAIESAVKKYQAVGYTDDEILKLMK